MQPRSFGHLLQRPFHCLFSPASARSARVVLLSLASASLLLTTSCETSAQDGALIGTLAGAGIGVLAAENSGRGALIGGALGAVAGAAIGSSSDDDYGDRHCHDSYGYGYGNGYGSRRGYDGW